MTYVATLMSNPAAPALDDAVLRARAARCSRRRSPIWLDPGIAAEIVFAPGIDSDRPAASPIICARCSATSRSTSWCNGSRTRRKKLLVADMDSTMIGQECIDELADFAGLKAHVAAITERAMRGEIAFEPALARARRPAQGTAGFGGGKGDRRAHHAHAGRANAGADHAQAWRADLPRLGRVHAVHAARSPT